MDITANPRRRLPGIPFEGSDAAREFIARVEAFIETELTPLAEQAREMREQYHRRVAH